MVLKILADTREFLDDRNSVPKKFACWADAGQQEQLRRIDGAPGENDLLLGMDLLHLAIPFIADAPCPAAIEQDLQDMGIGQDREVGSLRDGVEIGPCRAASAPVLQGTVQPRESLRLCAIQVVGDGMSGLCGCSEKRVKYWRVEGAGLN